MTRNALATNFDSTYSDSGTDPSVQIHQAIHDAVDAVLNNFSDTLSTATVQNARLFLGWASNTEGYQGLTVLSTDVPGIVTNAQSGTAYTLVLTDAGKLIELSNAAAVALTIPPNSSVAFPVGTVVSWRQYGAGQVTLTPGAGVTLRSRGAALKSAGQYAEGSATKRATDEWVISGDVTT